MVGGLRGIGSLKNIVKPSLKVEVELEGVDVVLVACVALNVNLGGKIIFNISYTYLKLYFFIRIIYKMESGELDGNPEKYYEKLKRELGDDHPDTLNSLNNLALLFYNKGEYDRALPLYEECLAKKKRVLGDDDPTTLAALHDLAYLFGINGEYDRALPLYEECLAKRKRVLGEDHPGTLASLYNLVFLLERNGEYDRALPMYEELLAKKKRVLGEDHPDTLAALDNLAFLLERNGEYDRASNLARGGTKKKRHFRKSKKSKLTKRSRNVRRSRNRKGGMINSEIKDKIKKLALTEDKKGIDNIKYTANYDTIYSLWRSLDSEENKNKFAEEFVKAANTFFTDHSYRAELYERIIADLRATDKYNKSHPTELEVHKSPPSLNVTYRGGGKSRRRHHNRRSSKKYKKARKSRRANRRHSRKH